MQHGLFLRASRLGPDQAKVPLQVLGAHRCLNLLELVLEEQVPVLLYCAQSVVWESGLDSTEVLFSTFRVLKDVGKENDAASGEESCEL